MSEPPSLELRVPGAQEMTRLGVALAAALRAGDVVVLAGELGAGKTTLARGIGQGLGVRGPVTSPTFVISRVHPALAGGPDLVHVDAYRLSGARELDDLDLDADLDRSVVLVEWGQGLAEGLAEGHLLVAIHRPLGAGDEPAGQVRTVRITGHGPAWLGRRLSVDAASPGGPRGPGGCGTAAPVAAD